LLYKALDVGVERADLGVDRLDAAGEGDHGSLDGVTHGVGAWPWSQPRGLGDQCLGGQPPEADAQVVGGGDDQMPELTGGLDPDLAC
jgi:hypothetical protein